MTGPIITNDIKALANAEEGPFFDLKSARIKPEDLARHIVAFANAAGGKLVIGIEDDRKVTGFARQGAQNIERLKRCAIADCSPSPSVHCTELPVTNANRDDDVVLVLDIDASPDRVIARRKDGAIFLRQNDSSKELDHEQILALERDKNQRVFEDELITDSSIEDVDLEVLARYKSLLGTDAPDEQVLRSRRFMRDGHLTVAGLLMFGTCPAAFFPQARVRVLRFDGTKMETGERLNITKDVTFDGPIPKVIDGAHTLISSMLRDFQLLGKDGKFQTVPEYPEFAWFEGLVNAIAHRDYAFIGDYIRVSMYDDRLEILSPGKLPNIVTLDNMRVTRYSRNPQIARTLVEFGWVRELNEGVQRIYTEMQSMFLNDPIYAEPESAKVLLTLENNIVARTSRQRDALEERLSREVMKSLNEYELLAVRVAFVRGKITPRELSELICRSQRTSSRTLKNLTAKGILTFHGSSPSDPKLFYSLA